MTLIRPEVRRREAQLSPALCALDPVLARIYSARGITSQSQLEYKLSALPHFNKMAGMDAATALLCEALRCGQHIFITGDSDADGATSTALMGLALEAFGAKKVSWLVPDRFVDGYGLSVSLADKAVQEGAELIITVDNGVSCHAGIDAAQSKGVPVIVTDHHLPPETLPAAAAMVNPNQPDCAFPSRNLAGVGVAFYVLLALRAALRQQGWFNSHPEPNLAQWLDLVALGTVADVVPLDEVNRALVEQGLQRINARRCRPGIIALLEAKGPFSGQIKASDLAFSVAPRLNAAGRLENMGLGIQCLLTDSAQEASELAAQLHELNLSRRDMEQQMRDEAMACAKALHIEAGELPPVLTLHDDTWHQGIVGLVAGRVREEYHRPVIAFADGDNGLLKGSARSVPGVHIRDVLAWVDSRHPGLMDKFGGHAMAAGLSLARDNLDSLSEALQEAVNQLAEPGAFEPVIWTDGPLPTERLSLSLARLLESAGPWGQGFPEPTFDNVFLVSRTRVVGDIHLQLELTDEDGRRFRSIWFRPPPAAFELMGKRARFVYKPAVNLWQGNASLQLMIEYGEAL